jgi:hypothetical protein
MKLKQSTISMGLWGLVGFRFCLLYQRDKRLIKVDKGAFMMIHQDYL